MMENRYFNKWLVAFIPIVILVVYGRTIFYGFSPLDDSELFLNKIAWLSQLKNLPLLFTNTLDNGMMSPFFRPVLMISFMWDAMTGKDSSIPFHITNVLIHIFTCMFLYAVLKEAIRNKFAALLWTLIFAVHPLLVPAVAWIPGRNDSLAAFFTLGAVYALYRNLEDDKNRWITMNVIFFFLAMFTKEQLIFLPLVFLIIIYFSRLENISLATFAIIWFMEAVFFLGIRSYVVTGNIIFSIPGGLEYFQHLISAFIINTGKIILPVQQAVIPTTRDTSLIPGIIVLLLLTFTAIRYGIRDRKIFSVGLYWYLILLAIPLFWGSIQDEHFEHRMYIPMIGFIIMLSQLKIFNGLYNLKPSISLNIVLVALVVVFGYKSFTRSAVYRNDLVFAETAVEESPHHSRSHFLLANVYKKYRQFDDSIREYDKSIELNPTYEMAINNRGDLYLALNDFDSALSDFNLVLSINPNHMMALNNRSVTLYFMGRYQEAWKDAQKVLLNGGRIHPDFLKALEQALVNNNARG